MATYRMVGGDISGADRDSARDAASPGETSAAVPWPAEPLADWAATKDTFHLYLQIIGKIRLACTPLINHWWNVPQFRSDFLGKASPTHLFWGSPDLATSRGYRVHHSMRIRRLACQQ